MQVVTYASRPPALRRPVLVAAFEGWNDAGEAATGAADAVRRATQATEFASIDSEEFFDFQATRPIVRLAEGGARELEWPSNEFAWARLPGADRDVVILTGTEPNLRWRTFTDGVVELARELGVELVVTLGALQVDSPHTRPVPVTGSASDRRLIERFSLRRSTYEGPTGITGVLHHVCAEAGLDAVSLWAGIPHYLAATVYLAGALALVDRFTRLLGADIALDDLARDAAEQRDDVAAFVAEDEDLAEYVTELERRYVEDQEVTLEQLPAPTVTGDELAAELERFLRDRGDG
jgi:proteasome assembly chaperone (PAC2) family protein